MTNINFSSYVLNLFWTLLIAVGLFLLLKFISKSINYFIVEAKFNQKVRNAFFIFQIFIWIFFIVIVFNSSSLKGLTYNPVFLVVVGVVLLLVVLTAGKDIFAGFALRIEESLTLNSTIKSEAASGKIVKLGLRSVTLQPGNGETIRLPYSQLTSSRITLSKSESKFKTFETEIKIQQKESPEETKQIIKTEILNSPYCSIKQSPEITFLGQENNQHRFKISASVMSEDYFNRLINNLTSSLS